MTLTSRLSLFFVTALGLVLVGFSAALYLAAQSYLARQADDRLAAALDALTAIAEIEPSGIEWDPSEHIVRIGAGSGLDQVRWMVQDDAGHIVDHSANLGRLDLKQIRPKGFGLDGKVMRAFDTDRQPWHITLKRLSCGRISGPSLVSAGRKRVYPALELTAAISMTPIEKTLHDLAVILAALCLGLWLLGLVLGRWLCRRGLAPLGRMATAAGQIDAEDLGPRLPVPESDDELETLGKAINGLLTRLQEAFERQRRFSGDASHQFRTPLTAMRGQVEVALRRDRTPAEYRETLRALDAQTERLQRLVEMLLFLARKEDTLAELQPLDLTPWLDEHFREWQERYPTIELFQPGSIAGGCSIMAHEALLEQLLENLLDNAVKYGGAAGPVMIRLERSARGVILIVEDHGPGISPDDLPHIFEPFYRSKQSRLQGRPGIGLGLTIARRIAEALGATITTANVKGGGARFIVSFPPGDSRPSPGSPVRQGTEAVFTPDGQ